MNSKIFFICILLLSFDLQAKINVVTTLPDFAELALEIGGELVEVESLLEGTEDIHHTDALPYYILKLQKADVICYSGMDLEVGWLPRVLMKTANPKILPGAHGNCELGKFITPLEVPKGEINRSMGDLHSSGNPHFNLGITPLIESANYMVKVFSMVDPKNSATYLQNFSKLKLRLENLKNELNKKMLKPLKIIQYHQEFSYFLNEYSHQPMGSIEEKPGVPPSLARLARAAALVSEQAIVYGIASPFAPEKSLSKFQDLAKIKIFKAPVAVQKNNNKLDTIEKVQRHIFGLFY